jgi:hypothetical protein
MLIRYVPMRSSLDKFMTRPARQPYRAIAACFVILFLAGFIVTGIHALKSGEWKYAVPLSFMLYCIAGFTGVACSGIWFRFRSSTGT